MDTQIDNIPTEILQILSPNQAWFYRILPCSENKSQITFFAATSSNNKKTIKELSILTGKDVLFIEVAEDIISKQISRYYRKSDVHTHASKILTGRINEMDDFLKTLICETNAMGCSDIHVEPYEKKSRIRIRIDGKLIEKYILNNEDYPLLINKIKIKANLDISEKRLPQDGRITFSDESKTLDIRVSILPSLFGEKVVMRLLSKDASSIEIADLGFSENQLNIYLQNIKKTHGIILISGPTGSGKTTTLYATLQILNKTTSNILTIEDPVEYTLEGINQVQLKENIGLTFANALKTFMRQDPDIIMIGEIRDAETAQMAIRAALTGHLVLSTIHTNSALGTVARLIDMGIPPFLLSGTLILSVAQRLIRILCPYCKIKVPFNFEFPEIFKPSKKISHCFDAVGCEKCFYTGFLGRKAIFEMVEINEDTSRYIRKGEVDIIQKNILSNRLSDQAYDLFHTGLSNFHEVYPVFLNTAN